MRRLIVGLIAAAIPFVPAAAAPSVPAPATVPANRADSASIAAANRLLDAMHYDRLLDRTIDAVVVEMNRTIDTKLNAELSEPLPPEILGRIKAITETHMRATFRDHRMELRRGTATIYANHFSIGELQRLAELQSDPAMVKMQEELPQIAADTMALSQALVAGQREQVTEEVKAVVEDYFRNRSGKPSS